MSTQPHSILLRLALACLVLLPQAFLFAADSDSNIAFGRPVTASGRTWGSFLPSALTDGDTSTICHPLNRAGNLGFFFQVDLGRDIPLQRIILRNRTDGCCPERLSRFQVSLFANANGQPGALRWSRVFRPDGSHSGVAGSEIVEPVPGDTGTFNGRFIRITQVTDQPYSPQLSEIEAYPADPPKITHFSAAPGIIEAGESSTISWQVLGADVVTLVPGDSSPVPGTGSVVVRPSSTTQYVLTASNSGGTTIKTLRIGIGVTLLPPQISEFLATNSGGLEDEDGETPDWIEIHNPNEFPLAIGGYQLSDDPGQTSSWVIPEGILMPYEYRVIFASGKNRRNPEGTWHTSFKLDASGDQLALLDRGGKSVLQQFPPLGAAARKFPNQAENISFGLTASNQVAFFTPPTPGVANGNPFDGVVAPVSFSQSGGFVDTPFHLELACPTEGASIRYTTNLAEPTATTGTIYGGAIHIRGNTIVRAIATRPGWAYHPSVTHTFLFPSEVLKDRLLRTNITQNSTFAPSIPAALMDLPAISLTAPTSPNDTSEVPINFEWINPDGTPGATVNAGVIRFGGAFTDFPKKNFRVFFRTEYGASALRYPVFRGFERGLEPPDAFDSLELRSGSHDMSMRGFYLSNPFTDDTMLELGRLAPHGRFVHVHLNGRYWGVYHLRERWGAAMHRRYLGGRTGDYESINGNYNVGGWAEPGDPYDGTGDVWKSIKEARSDYVRVAPWLDVPDYVDYMTVFMFGGSEDEYRATGPNQPGSGFKFLLNDADGWFCIPEYCAADNRTRRSSPGRQSGDGPGSLYSMLVKEGHPDFQTLLGDQLLRALSPGGALFPAENLRRLDSRAAELERPFLLESARWNNLSPVQWRNRLTSARNSWFARRTSEVFSQFRAARLLPSLAAPKLNIEAGSHPPGVSPILLSSAGAENWYTLDGSDPRESTGVPSPTATRVANGLLYPFPPLDRNTWIRARARAGTNWSPLLSTFLQISNTFDSRLIVGEIHLPNEQSPGEFRTEFIELQNIGEQPINLRGARWISGPRHRFPTRLDQIISPGQRWVLCHDELRFRKRFGFAPHATYRAPLPPGGDRLTLVDADDRTLIDFEFRTRNPWPLPDPALPNQSLHYIQPERLPSDPRAWARSRLQGGSPGGPEPAFFEGDPSADSDSDGLGAAMEFLLGTSESNPMSGPGWWRWEFLDSSRLALRFIRREAIVGFQYSVEASSDLQTWRSLAIHSGQFVRAGFLLDTRLVDLPSRNQFVRIRIIP